MRVNDLPLSTKLWGLVLAVLVSLTAVAVYNQQTSRSIQEDTLARLRTADDLIAQVSQWRTMSQRNTEITLATNLSPDEAGTAFFAQRLKAGMAESSAIQKKIIEGATSPRDKAMVETMVERRKAVLALVKKMGGIKAQGDIAGVRTLLESEFLPTLAAYDQAQGDMLRLQETQRDEALADGEQRLRRAAMVAIGLLVVVLAVALVSTLLLLRSIVAPLREAVAAAESIATGDLRYAGATDRADEIGRMVQAMGSMSAKLRHLVHEVRQGVGSVDVASSEIATGNHDLSVRTEQTASHLQQTASSLEQVTGTIRQSADHAGHADKLAADAQAAAARSGDAVGQVVGRMEEITASSRKIAEITAVIDGIAFQTNILALNAAVEAARAGEQGRGFAVVAAEVRSLAQRSGEAAKEIRQLIAQSVETVEAGSRQVGVARDVIGDVVVGVRRVADLIGELSNAATEQRDGIQQVNQAVSDIDEMTQQNAALVEEAAAAASSLRDQSRRLAETVSVFKTQG